jgi:hypothetical protein
MKTLPLLFVLLFSSCSVLMFGTRSPNLPDSLEIRHQLSNSTYRYLAIANEDSSYLLTSFKDDHKLEQRNIPQETFLKFYTFFESQLPNLIKVPMDSSCRTPFIVTIAEQDHSKVIQGCRSLDENGVLGKILQEGEQLFYTN